MNKLSQCLTWEVDISSKKKEEGFSIKSEISFDSSHNNQ